MVEDINPKIKNKIKLPSEGIVTFEPDFSKVDNAELCINKYSIKYENREARYQPDEDYCIFSNEPENPTPQPFIEPEGEYVRELCKGTSSYSSSTIYKVKKVEDMACLSKVVNEGNNFSNAQVQVVSDVDFKNTSDYVDSNTTLYGDINENGSIESLYTELTTGKGFKPIGNSTNKYIGSFIGNMFTISNITINRPEEDYVGIFGFFGDYGYESNLQKCKFNNISVTGQKYVGGLVGYFNGAIGRIETIEATNITVTGNTYVGGLVGEMFNGTTINEIKFDTTVTGDNYVGGIQGSGRSVTNVVGNTVVTGTGNYVGGITGDGGTINGVLLEGGSVTGRTAVGNTNNRNYSNIFYYDGFTATITQGIIIDKDNSKNINSYETAIDTIIGGDNDGTGYYFRFDENNKIQLVKESDYPIRFTLKGSGTEQDPYLISNIREWNEATTKAQLAGVHFKLTKDLNFKGREFLKMGSPTTPFRGVLDGNNHKIKNAKIVGGAYQGVFGYLASTAVVKDLTIENSKIEKASAYVGMLAGYVESGATITNIKIPNANVEGMGYTGGLVGYSLASLTNLDLSNITVTNTGNVDYNFTGGIAGYFGYYGYTSNIQKCKFNNISVTGQKYVGGLVGYFNSPLGRIETIEATNITVTGNTYVGGLVGEMFNGTAINEIKFDTTVTGDNYVGGIQGSGRRVTNVVGSTVVTGTGNYVGGITGDGGTLDGVLLEGGSVTGRTAVGNVNNRNYSNIFYYDGFTATITQGIIIDKDNSKNINSYETAIDTIIGGDNDGTGYYFRFDEKNKIQLVKVSDYPINFTLSGTGTEEDPYLISNIKEWNEATTKAQLVNTYFKLTVDLDFNGKEFLKMGSPTTPFRGVLDGNNHKLKNVKIVGGAYQGVFGYLASTAVVKDLTIENSKIEKASAYVGMLAGYAENGASITNVKIPNTNVEGMGYTGGLLGYSLASLTNLDLSNITVTNTGNIDYNFTGGIAGYFGYHGYESNLQKCKFNNISVTGQRYVGGLVGYFNSSLGRIETIEATNITVTGNTYVGGLVGEMFNGTTINEIKFDTTVTGDNYVGGVQGNGRSVTNVVGSTVVTGTGNYVGGITGYGNAALNLILESGNSSGKTFGAYNTSSYSGYYIDGFTASTVQGTKWGSEYLHNIVKYSDVVETYVTGDVNGTGYFFDLGDDGQIHLVEAYEASIGGTGSQKVVEKTVSTGSDQVAPECTLNYVNVIKNGFEYSFSCTDDIEIDEITSLFDHDPYNGQYDSSSFNTIGTIKNGIKTNSNKTSSYTSRWTTANSNPPDKNTCYYFSYGGKDKAGNYSVYHTSSCYQY